MQNPGDSEAVTRTGRSTHYGSILIIKMAVPGVAAILQLQRLLGVRILSQDLSPCYVTSLQFREASFNTEFLFSAQHKARLGNKSNRLAKIVI